MTYTKDSTGGTTSTSLLYWKGWADVEEGNYKQAMEFGQPTGNAPITVILRKNNLTKNITTSMELVYRGRNYNIKMLRELDIYNLELMAMRKD